jgi:hypothetical protein
MERSYRKKATELGWNTTCKRLAYSYTDKCLTIFSGMVSVPLPDWLLKLGTRMAKESGVFDGYIPNHVLVNEYLPGGGIMVI